MLTQRQNKNRGNVTPKGSPELTAARKKEIINACEQLYQTMSFRKMPTRNSNMTQRQRRIM